MAYKPKYAQTREAPVTRESAQHREVSRKEPKKMGRGMLVFFILLGLIVVPLSSLLTACFLNHNAFFCRLCHNAFDRTFYIALLHQQFFNISAAAQHFQHGISAFQLIFVIFTLSFFQKKPLLTIFPYIKRSFPIKKNSEYRKASKPRKEITRISFFGFIFALFVQFFRHSQTEQFHSTFFFSIQIQKAEQRF